MPSHEDACPEAPACLSGDEVRASAAPSRTPPVQVLAPVLDRESLLARIDSDGARLLEFIELLDAHAPKMLSELREELARGDARGVHRVAHSFTGSLASLGGMAAAQRALRLARHAQCGALGSAVAMLDDLERDVSRLRSALCDLQQELPS